MVKVRDKAMARLHEVGRRAVSVPQGHFVNESDESGNLFRFIAAGSCTIKRLCMHVAKGDILVRLIVERAAGGTIYYDYQVRAGYNDLGSAPIRLDRGDRLAIVEHTGSASLRGVWIGWICEV